MDRVAGYRDIIVRLLSEYSVLKPSYGDVETEVIIDRERDHYELAFVGWDDFRRIHGPVLHLDVRDGKVWIQHDGSEHGIASELVEAGIPPEHIVLGFQHPAKRKYSHFAVS